jgi:hypothetical protein
MMRTDSRSIEEPPILHFRASSIAGVVGISGTSGCAAAITPRRETAGTLLRWPELTATREMAQRAITALRVLASVAVLPHVTLCEASIVGSLLTSRDFFEPRGVCHTGARSDGFVAARLMQL